jgi:hypothetical protein
VAQFSRVLSTLLAGGIPLVQALDTAGDSLGTPLLGRALGRVTKLVREGQTLSGSLKTTRLFPPLSIDMIEVGESTGALPAMLNSVAEFYEEDVNTRMTAALSLIEPAIMIFMGIFVAFVLIALYLGARGGGGGGPRQPHDPRGPGRVEGAHRRQRGADPGRERRPDRGRPRLPGRDGTGANRAELAMEDGVSGSAAGLVDRRGAGGQ